MNLRRSLIVAWVVVAAGLAPVWSQDVEVGAPVWSNAPGANDEPPEHKRPLRPVYPPEMNDANVTGYVMVRQFLNAEGKRLVVHARGSHRPFERAVEEALPIWTVSAAKSSGRPVDSLSWVPVIFNPEPASASRADAIPRLLAVTPGIVPRELDPKGVPSPTVPIVVQIDAQGAVAGVALAPGVDPRFLPHVQRTLQNWRFAPARKGGQPVASELSLKMLMSVASDQLQPMRPPEPLTQREPEYPFAMQRLNLRGEVIVAFDVNTEGRVEDATVHQSNNPGFNEAAVACVMKWTFKPALLDGKPVVTKMRVPIVFEIIGGGNDAYAVRKSKGSSKLPPALQHDVPPKLRGIVTPVFPYALRLAGQRGSAKATMVVDIEGRVYAVKVTETTQPEFGLALTAALETFVFEPATKEGKPVVSAVGYEQKFDRSTFDDSADERLLRLEKKLPNSFAKASTLDAPIKPLSRKQPKFPTALMERATGGSAVIDCIIDEEGRARLPRIVSASHEAFGYAAVQAVGAWSFEPPKAAGKAVAVRLRVPIQFALEKVAAP